MERSYVGSICYRGLPPGQCSSYKPISLSSVFGKLFEFFILERNKLVENKRVLKYKQFGLRAGLSSLYALTVFSFYVASGLHKRHDTIAVGFDFSKAFNTVLDR